MAERMDVEARIAHCLRLAQDPGATQSERDLAEREAERLLAKHAIDRLGIDVEGDRPRRHTIETEAIIVEGGTGSLALDVALAVAKVARALGLVPHYVDRRRLDAWERDGGERPRVELRITGFRADLVLALPLLATMPVQMQLAVGSWWRAEPSHRGVPRWDAQLARRGFVSSFGDGAAARIRADRGVAAAGTAKALVVASREQEVQEWVRQHVPLRSGRRRTISSFGRDEGYRAGYRSGGSTARAVAAPLPGAPH